MNMPNDFLEKLAKYCLTQTKNEHLHQLLSISNSRNTKFQLKLTCWFSGRFNFGFLDQINPNRGISNLNKKTIKITIKFYIFYTSASAILILLEQISQKWILPIENRKNEHYHWGVHIRISLSTKYQLKLII